MKNTLHLFANYLGRVSIISGRWVSWLTLAMVIILTLNVLSSWLLNTSSILLTEAVTWMHSANFLMAAAYTLNRDEHVRVDIFYGKFSRRKKAWVDLSGTLLLLLPVSLFIFWSSWSFVMLSWRIGETSAEAGGMPWLFILKGFLLIMPVLLIIEALHQLFSKIDFLLSSDAHLPPPTMENADTPSTNKPAQGDQ